MNCTNHENEKARFICQDCGVNICNECAVNNNGEIICLQCADNRGLVVIKSKTMKGNENHFPYESESKYRDKGISSFWGTILSFMPGAGHMYLGLIKKGLQIMIAFFATIALSSYLYSSEIFTAFATVIWFYSVFDCYHTRKKLQLGEHVSEDLVFDINFKNINTFYLGIGLIVFGGITLLDELLTRFMFYIDSSRIYYDIIRVFRGSLLPLLLIFGGIYLIRKRKNNVKA